MDGSGPARAGGTEVEVGLPRMAAVFPMLVAEIDRLLTLDGPDGLPAGAVGDLRYYGRCRCTPTCRNLLTAPAGSAGPYLVQLDRDGIDVIWLGLDPSGMTVVDIEVLDSSGLDVNVVDR